MVLTGLSSNPAPPLLVRAIRADRRLELTGAHRPTSPRVASKRAKWLSDSELVQLVARYQAGAVRGHYEIQKVDDIDAPASIRRITSGPTPVISASCFTSYPRIDRSRESATATYWFRGIRCLVSTTPRSSDLHSKPFQRTFRPSSRQRGVKSAAAGFAEETTTIVDPAIPTGAGEGTIGSCQPGLCQE